MNDTPTLETTSTVQVAQAQERAAHNVMTLSGEMVVLTWVMFTITAFILYKMAWKPILAVLDKRESGIKRSLDEAAKAQKQAEETKAKCEAMIAETGDQSRQIIEQARKSALEATESIQNEAREQARILLDNAQRDIGFEKEKAIGQIRRESADLAIEIAGRLIQKNLDTDSNRALTDQLLKKL